MYFKRYLLFLFKSLLLFNLILKFTKCEPLSPRSIRLRYGVLRGVLRHYNKQNVPVLPSSLLNLPDKFSIEIFRSIPFAQAPISNLKFMPPVTQSRWRGTKLANRFAPVCMQNTAEIASSDLLSSLPSSSSSSSANNINSLTTNKTINTVKTQHVNTVVNNKDKIHEFSSTPSTLSFVSNSFQTSTLLSLNSSSSSNESILASVPSSNKILKRTKRKTDSKVYSTIKNNIKNLVNSRTIGRTASVDNQNNQNINISTNKLNSSNNLTDRRPARSIDDDINDQFDRHFISNLLRIHPAYFKPFTSYIRNQNEDCLFLNLYIPYKEEINNKEQYPVVVYVHGESFDWGSGNAYDGSILAGVGNLIVVTLNYRLGVFGFMPSLIEGAVRTNHGILDVIASLHWIQDNIEQFGGNKSNIQLIGHQRGASIVQFLMKSQLSKGLFQRAVLLSGSSFSNWALAEQLEFYTRMLANKVDCLETQTTPKDNLLNLNSNNFNSFLSSNEHTNLFHSAVKLSVAANQTSINYNQLSSSDERIFQCLRSRSSEQLRTASIRLNSKYYSPFFTLFGPTIDSLLIIDKHLANPLNKQMLNYLNYSNNSSHIINKKLKISNADSNHNLLIGFTANLPRIRPALRQMIDYLSKMVDNNGLHFFYVFLKDFIDFVITQSDRFLNDQNDFNEIFYLNNSFNDNENNLTDSTNWLVRRKNDLLNIISSLLLDVMIISPLLTTANIHQPGSVYTFFLPFEQNGDEFSDQELAHLFGSSLASYYYNVTDNFGRFKTNQTGLKQVQQSQRLISTFLNFFRNGQPNNKQEDQIPNWPIYDLKSRNYLNMDKQWKIKSATSGGRLNRWLKLVNLLDDEKTVKGSLEFSKFSSKLSNEIRLGEKLSYDLRKNQFESILNQIKKHIDLKIKNLGYSERMIKQRILKNKLFDSSQMNKSNESPDPGGGQSSVNRSMNDYHDLKRTLSTFQNSNQNNLSNTITNFFSTGNLARINNHQLNNNQTDKYKSPINQFLSSFGFNGFSSIDNGEKNKSFYTNAMITIISAGLMMLFVNIFVLFLGYKCIQRRKILKQHNERSKEKSTMKDNQTNQLLNSTSNSTTINTLNYNRQNLQTNNDHLLNNSIDNKCFCDSGGDSDQFCNCSDVGKLQLINSNSSFFTTDTLITTDQPLSQLVSPVCKLISNEQQQYKDYNNYNDQNYSKTIYETTDVNKLNSLINNQLLVNNDSNKSTNCYTDHLKDKNQIKLDDNNLQNCDCNLLATTNTTPMLAVLETTANLNDNTNLLTELSTIGCESNLYKFFESNYYSPFDSNNIESVNSLQSHGYQTTNLQSNTLSNTLTNTLPNTNTVTFYHHGTNNINTNSSTEQHSQTIQAHNTSQQHHHQPPPQTIQLQLLTDLLNTPLQTNN